MTSEFQPGDKLRDILQRARERSAATAVVPAAHERTRDESLAEALLDRNQPLPDARALSRLYKDEALTVRLPESLETEAETASTGVPTPGGSGLPAPAPLESGRTEQVPPPPVWADGEPQPSQPIMSPAEIRSVMQKLQSEFGGSYKVFEIPQAPADDISAQMQQEWDRGREQELAELKRLADESASTNWIFAVGSVVVAVIVGIFIYLAAVGPLRASPTPAATPSPTTRAALQ